ncbi:MAG TPA: methylmalonyl-CoA mutase family protein [Tepidisphaeraceae bacterium]|jgi:methylmalonyl-CoA mutase|nr:methylmalonyl-CoA mutase family protein [Tepidisphaeraceae bacterium]
MSELASVIAAVEKHEKFVDAQVDRARRDVRFRGELLKQWNDFRASIGTVQTPTGLRLPRLALPLTDEPGEIARYWFGEGPPGQFPFANGVYPQMYATPTDGQTAEEPTRLFAGLGLPEDTNRRFHFLTHQQRSIRLSTAFDGPTLYGLDSDHEGVFGKIGEGGVAISTVDDMARLFADFPLGDPHFSASMTINAPAPILLAMYVAAARRRFGPEVVAHLRGTVQADILKEVQAQNEIIFPLEASLRFLTDMVQYCAGHMPRWYPISISGYHIAEAGATPVQQAAYTLSNGFTYVQLFRDRGLDVNQFGPRLSFFLDCGLDIEYLALARVCRKIWAIVMRDCFKADERAQRFKLHTQTSGRSLIADEFQNNLTRTAIELLLAYANATNSCHSNSADEPFTTPSEQYVKLAAHGQAILLEETGLFKFMECALAGSPGMKTVERAVESAILDEFRELDRLGGVLPAITHRYQRSQIQSAAHQYERQIYDGVRPIIALNRYADPAAKLPQVRVVRTPRKAKQKQIDRLEKFKRRHARQARKALDDLAAVVDSGGNTFAQLIETVEHCSLGQITERLHELVGRFRPMV